MGRAWRGLDRCLVVSKKLSSDPKLAKYVEALCAVFDVGGDVKRENVIDQFKLSGLTTPQPHLYRKLMQYFAESKKKTWVLRGE